MDPGAISRYDFSCHTRNCHEVDSSITARLGSVAALFKVHRMRLSDGGLTRVVKEFTNHICTRLQCNPDSINGMQELDNREAGSTAQSHSAQASLCPATHGPAVSFVPQLR